MNGSAKRSLSGKDKLFQAWTDLMCEIFAHLYGFKFVACDGCGKKDIEFEMKSIKSPFFGSKIYICKSCWDEFMNPKD